MIPLFKPHMPSCPDLQDLLHSGRLAYGKYAKEFESGLCEMLGVNDIMGVSSFGAAITAALITLGIGAGDEIIASPMSCLVSTQPLISTGAKVVWADVDPALGILCPNDVRSKITSHTKLIVVNHFCGIVGDINGILEVGRAHGIPVAEDVLEGFGGKYYDNPIGSLCDLSWISFGYVRQPQALDAAACWFADEVLSKKLRLVCDLGIDRARFRTSSGEINPLYSVDQRGISAAMGEVQGYIGIHSLREFDELLTQQKNNAKYWDILFEGSADINSIINAGTDFCYWVYPVLANDKSGAILHFDSLGYAVSGVHTSNHEYKVFGWEGKLVGVDEFQSRFLALPCGWWVNESELSGGKL